MSNYTQSNNSVISQITSLTDIIRDLKNCMDTNGDNRGGQQQSRGKGKETKIINARQENTAGPTATVVTTSTPAKTR